jgi:hypothetical protein
VGLFNKYVGVDDGDTVGGGDGEADGSFVGFPISYVGISVGDTVGAILGLIDGLKVGVQRT